MSEPDYTKYTLEELRDARRSIDVNRYAERAARLDLLIRDREQRAKDRAESAARQDLVVRDQDETAKHTVEAPTVRGGHESSNRATSCVRVGLGCAMLLMGIYGLGLAAALVVAKSVFQDPEMLGTLQELSAFGRISDEMIELLPLRAALGGIASVAYCVAGMAVLLKSRRASLIVFVAAGLATARQMLEVGLGLGMGGMVAFMAVSSATVAIVVHVGIALAIYFTDPEHCETPPGGPSG